MMQPKTKSKLINLSIDLFLGTFCLLMITPLVLLTFNAFKPPEEISKLPATLLPQNFTTENITTVLGSTPLLQWILNSFLFAICSTLAILVTSAIGGYIFGKFRYRSMNIIFLLVLVTAIVPFEVYMIPLYFQVQKLGLLNSLGGLLIGYLVMSFGIFLIRQNVIASIPDELLEAARIDGAGEARIFLTIVLPLLRAPLGALAVLAFFQAWSAFAWPLIIATKKPNFTIEVGLAFFQTGFTIDIGLLSAAATIVMIPTVILFSLLRKNFVEGVQTSGIKE